MSNPAYEVHVSTHHWHEDNVDTFSAIEVIPPISRALAELACEEVKKYCDALYEEDNPGKTIDHSTEVTPYGFCDEGATVNTLFKFKWSPTLEGGSVEALDATKYRLGRLVRGILSPSGAAIAKK